MPRLDVYLMRDGTLSLDCQSDQLDYLSSRLTVPLIPESEMRARVAALHPRFELDEVPYIMATHLAGAVPARVLQRPIASLKQHEFEVQRALDTLTASY